MNVHFSAIARYINANSCAVLGTTNKDGTPHGAVIYACALPDRSICFLTKSGTQKYKNLAARPQVCVTFLNEKESSSLQVTGTAAVVTDARHMSAISQAITRVQTSQTEWLSPISKLRAGEYEYIAVRITHAHLAEYKGRKIGSQHIFSEL